MAIRAGDRKVARTRRLESLRYVAWTFWSAGSGDIPVPSSSSHCLTHFLSHPLLRRLENPDIPEDVWHGIEDAEDGRLVDMETALTQKPPSLA